jgi:hypothetical protein
MDDLVNLVCRTYAFGGPPIAEVHAGGAGAWSVDRLIAPLGR